MLFVLLTVCVLKHVLKGTCETIDVHGWQLSKVQPLATEVSSTVGGYSRHPGTFGMLNQATRL